METNHNNDYAAFVHGDGDVVGHVAYSLHLRDGSAAAGAERYRERAVLVLQDFMNCALEEVTKQIESDYISDQEMYLERVVQANKSGFWRGVGQYMLGVTLVALIAGLAALAYLLW